MSSEAPYGSTYVADIEQTKSRPNIAHDTCGYHIGLVADRQIAAMRTQAEWVHERAHQGEPDNELVDALCWLRSINDRAHTDHQPTIQDWVWLPTANIKLK